MPPARAITGFCRDCLAPVPEDEARCRSCHSPRLVRHPELAALTIAHIDCDAFYAAVEKRDRPDLRDRPVIVGGGKRGVVATACYIARTRGVKSAMPMFTALKLCPEAVVIKPDMAKYEAAGQHVRSLMLSVTPLVQPLSIDEAFLDLTGTERLHGQCAALTLARLVHRIEAEVGITASVGLAPNLFLAKLASDLSKPRGFSVIGAAETRDFLAARPVSFIWGVGKVTQEHLARDGITMIGQLQTMEKPDLMRRYGSLGAHLYHLARGEDHRRVTPDEETLSVSNETTFNHDLADVAELEKILWAMSEKVSRRAKADGLVGQTVTLKLKTADFRSLSRATTLDEPTLLAHRIFEAARPLLRKEANGRAFRLIGVGISHLSPAPEAEPGTSLDARVNALTKAEMAMDRLRDKFGRHAVERGLGFTASPPRKNQE